MGSETDPMQSRTFGLPYSAPSAVADWLARFSGRCETDGPTAVANALVQLGVETPILCSCDQELGELVYEEDWVLWWLHCHHRQYNRAVWELIPPKTRYAIRTVVKRDLLVPNTIPSSEDEYGHIVRKEYGRSLLEHFLVAKPEWC